MTLSAQYSIIPDEKLIEIISERNISANAPAIATKRPKYMNIFFINRGLFLNF